MTSSLPTLLDNKKLSYLIGELLTTRDVPGDLAEIGVYKGGSALQIAAAIPEKRLHLYDTFKGIVKATYGIDTHADGDFSNVDLEEIRKVLSDKKVIFHVGVFPDTFTEPNDLKFSFVHSDTDTYFGTQETLRVFYKRMSPGGKILFDDWKWPGCPGVEKAIREFLSTGNYSIIDYDYQIVICF